MNLPICQCTMKLRYWKRFETDRAVFISLDEQLWGVLNLRTLQAILPYHTDEEISQELATKLIETLKKKAWWQLTEYLAKSEHSTKQATDYLKRKHYHPEIIAECISLCTEKQYLNDARFAEILIRSLLERGKSKRIILQKLHEQNIASSVYESILQETEEPEEYKDRIISLMNDLVRKHQDLPRHKCKEKVFASLYRKGFDLDDISAAWEHLSSRL